MLRKLSEKISYKILLSMFLTMLIVLSIFYMYQWFQIKKDVEAQLSEKASGLAISFAKSLGTITELDIKNGVTLADGTHLSGDEIKENIFNDQLQIIPESEEVAKKRMEDSTYNNQTTTTFNGEIPLWKYELKYTSAYDTYTDERWQGLIDSFLTDESVTYTVPVAYSENPEAVGFVSTHNSKYSAMGEDSKDPWGNAGLLSQKYRANRVFNDPTGYNAAVNNDTTKVLVQKYPRIIEGKVVEMWDVSYPVMIDGKHWGGARIGISKEKSDLLIAKQRKMILIQFIIITMVVLGVFWILSHFFVGKRIKQLVRVTKNLNSSEADLTYRLPVQGHDELAVLSREINLFLDRLQALVNSVKQLALEVASSAEELSASSEETSSITDQMATSLLHVASGSERQMQRVKESDRAIHDMSVNIDHIVESSTGVLDISKKMEKEAGYGNQTVKNTVQQIYSISESVQQTEKVIDLLGKQSNEIYKIVDVITGIASQTDLLALNASIESARAGEHGRGFAVVAENVRKLAEQSKGSTAQISIVIQNIQKDIELAVTKMQKVINEVQHGVDFVKESGVAFNQILTSTKHVTGLIEKVADSSRQIADATKRVIDSMQDLNEIASNSNMITQNVAASSQEQHAAIEGVAHSAERLNQIVQGLEDELGQFKV